jgi:hypothetical protein
MNNYIWGVFISAFILDVIIKYSSGGDPTSNSTTHSSIQSDPSPKEQYEGMKIKLEGDKDIPVKYDGKVYRDSDKVQIHVQYW